MNGYRKYAPGQVRIPLVKASTCCVSEHDGWMCTRRDAHGGRHAARGWVDDDGMCPVYAVWAD